MKILAISHSAIQPTYHKKFQEISKYPNIQLRVLVPEAWFENYQKLLFSQIDFGQNLTFYSLKVAFPGYGSRFFFTRNIIRHFRNFRPDIIHLEEEPWSLCALQTIILRAIFCPKSKLIFRTSLSIPIKLKFNFLISLIEKLTFKKADYAFILSSRAGYILIQKGYNKGMRVSPNGVDTEIFKKMNVEKLKQDLGIAKDNFVIGYVGRLMRMKGLETLIKAFSLLINEVSLSKSHLLIIGSGEYKDEMLSLASALNVQEKIIFIDSVPANEIPKYINCMDVLVLPSITTSGWVEFFGRVLVEAMVCQVPVIGSNSGEIPNVIGDSGLIFQEGDEKDLKDKLYTILVNPQLRKSLAMKGFQRANSLYTWESIAKNTYEVYYDLTNSDIDLA